MHVPAEFITSLSYCLIHCVECIALRSSGVLYSPTQTAKLDILKFLLYLVYYAECVMYKHSAPETGLDRTDNYVLLKCFALLCILEYRL